MDTAKVPPSNAAVITPEMISFVFMLLNYVTEINSPYFRGDRYRQKSSGSVRLGGGVGGIKGAVLLALLTFQSLMNVSPYREINILNAILGESHRVTVAIR